MNKKMIFAIVFLVIATVLIVFGLHETLNYEILDGQEKYKDVYWAAAKETRFIWIPAIISAMISRVLLELSK